MASIFTYDPDPPRVSSPWSTSYSVVKSSSQSSITRLEAEPQEGPTEYKLHLLLRPRRTFTAMSTSTQAPSFKHARVAGSTSRSASGPAIGRPSTTPPTNTLQTRQHRLEQLTTQLLWRLQQSSPHHSTSGSNIILPYLPEALPELQTPPQIAKLFSGLEESKGALYEIGVSDDGTFVGLAEDELLESINNLGAMAASLGCTVELIRKVAVGRCEWLEEATAENSKFRWEALQSSREEQACQVQRSGSLWVAEVFVKPYLGPLNVAGVFSTLETGVGTRGTELHTALADELPSNGLPVKRAVQLRVSLTGATMSGKSSLLGTLTTATLDNGRGKSRLSMLKHRHEISSGVTSSVTQELLGYQSRSGGDVEIVNYATKNVSSWIDIHAAAANDRMVFVSDSAGHPRYRRTTVRGLVGWAPHWTVLCVPADDAEDMSGKTEGTLSTGDLLSGATADVAISGAHLDLCLRLGLPLIVVITKLDLASKSGLRTVLAKLLSTLKAAGKVPKIVPNISSTASEANLESLPNRAMLEAANLAAILSESPRSIVPIVMSSAVHGTGIDTLHTLLCQLPLISSANIFTTVGLPPAVFHIEDIYGRPANTESTVVSGHLFTGTISVGEELFMGPFSQIEPPEDSDDSDARSSRTSCSILPTSRSFPGALKGHGHLALRHQKAPKEWRRVRITSIRNLRLPVRTLHADQVGTLGMVPVDDATPSQTPALVRIRKGMVLCRTQPSATISFAAEFDREDLGSLAVGSHVVVYIASVRASARVVSARTPDPKFTLQGSTRYGIDAGDDNLAFDFDHGDQGRSKHNVPRVAGAITDPILLVTFQFSYSREYVAVGAKVLVMPGGGPGLYIGTERGEKGVAGLEGFVGTVTEINP
ncbi:hypothetical protein LTR50_003791 [Elasticomyces elasticus]|nr:hypothetical protein LTR50_003791 [Elasticomyces elasticus]